MKITVPTYCPTTVGSLFTAHSSLAEIHSFSAKERDAETGLSYFGARYYSSDLSIWLSVDPMASKYPSLSSYVYCADNPVKLVDPNGEKIFAVNEITKEYITKYMKDQFNKTDFFKFSADNRELKIKSKEYRNVYKKANDYQKVLLNGLKKACRSTSRVDVEIGDKTDFNFTYYTPVFKGDEIQKYNPEDGILRNVQDGATMPKGYGADCFVFINSEGAESTTMSSKGGNRTGKCASAVFFHELLDEFYNYYVKGKAKDSSSKLKKVYYENNALQNKGLSPRDGEDHL